MTTQPTLDLFTGLERKDRGIALVVAHNPDWAQWVRRIILSLSKARDTFTVEDVRKEAKAIGVPEPKHPNAWGAALSSAAGADHIEACGYRKNAIPSAHARVVRVWKAKAIHVREVLE